MKIFKLLIKTASSYLTPTYKEKTKNNSSETKQGCQLYMYIPTCKGIIRKKYLFHEKRKKN